MPIRFWNVSRKMLRDKKGKLNIAHFQAMVCFFFLKSYFIFIPEEVEAAQWSFIPIINNIKSFLFLTKCYYVLRSFSQLSFAFNLNLLFNVLCYIKTTGLSFFFMWMKFDLFPIVGFMIELNRSNTKLAINTSYRLNCKWDTGLYKIWLIIGKK